MKCLLPAMIYIAGASVASAAVAQTAVIPEDLRLLEVSERMQQANASLCRDHSPALGAALQSKDQFPEGRDPGFHAPVAFAAVLAGSPLDQAGVRDLDGLVAIAGEQVTTQPGFDGLPLRDSAHAMLSRHAGASELRLTIVRDGDAREVTVAPPVQCRALSEVLIRGGQAARTDGRVIQIGLDLVRRVNDEQLAVVFAHELAHSVLRHRARLADAGVSKGLAGEFGRDRKMNAEAEIEADRLSVHLLANAGYDPASAARFWREPMGRTIGGGLFRSRIYSSPEARAALLDREIADYMAGGAPTWPGHLLTSD